jgi:hypothetical protein
VPFPIKVPSSNTVNQPSHIIYYKSYIFLNFLKAYPFPAPSPKKKKKKLGRIRKDLKDYLKLNEE